MLKLRDVALVITTLAIGACGGTSPVETVDQNRGTLIAADGSYSFYAGWGVGDVIARGGSPGEDYRNAFTALKVPGAFRDLALQSPEKVRTISLEVEDPSIEIVVHGAAGDDSTPTLQTIYFHPGDPWVTGYAQVGLGEDLYVMGLFDVLYWKKADSSGSMPNVLAQQTYTTGLLPDSDMPVLKYASYPLPEPLPPNWN
jgi:hypothetical protein